MIQINFNWENAPEANPEGMTVVFYPNNSSSKIWRFELKGKDGGTIKVPIGVYNVLAYNSDFGNVEFSGTDDFYNLSASTPTQNQFILSSYSFSSNVFDIDNQRQSPMPLWAGSASNVSLSPCSMTFTPSDAFGNALDEISDQNQIKKINIAMFPRTCRYNIIVKDVENHESLSSAICFLVGVAESVRMYDDNLSEIPSAISMELKPSREFPLYGSQLGFGYNTRIRKTAILKILAILKDGSKFIFNQDVTDQIAEPTDKRNVNIYIGKLMLPEISNPTPNDPVVNPEVNVDGWHEVWVDKILN